MGVTFVDYGGLALAPDPSYQAWEVALDRIELDILRGARALECDSVLQLDEWEVPGDYGPIPDDLRERAQEILERQGELLQAIAGRLGVTLRHQAVVDGLSRISGRVHFGPVYLDITA